MDRFGFTATEVERVKKDLLRNYEGANKERDKSESRSLAAEYSRHFFTGEPIPGIALEAGAGAPLPARHHARGANRLARDSISEENRVILVSGPEKGPETELPTKEELLAVFAQVKTQQLAAYVDQVLDEPLVTERPAGSPAVSERLIPEVGVVEWTLGNGVKVVLKPTDFKNDEVLLTGFSPGGSSLVSDGEFNHAVFAAPRCWPRAASAASRRSSSRQGPGRQAGLGVAVLGRARGRLQRRRLARGRGDHAASSSTSTSLPRAPTRKRRRPSSTRWRPSSSTGRRARRWCSPTS